MRDDVIWESDADEVCHRAEPWDDLNLETYQGLKRLMAKAAGAGA